MERIPSRRRDLDSVPLGGWDHAGLLLDKYLPSAEYGSRAKSDRLDLLESVVKVRPPPVYRRAFTRWISPPDASQLEGRCVVDLTVNTRGRLAVGLGGQSAIETALTLSQTYGMPLLPGSALKGVLRHYLRAFWGTDFADKDGEIAALLLGHPGLSAVSGGDEEQAEATTEPGDDPYLGAALVTIHDGWFDPDSHHGGSPLCLDTITTHHPEYYTGSDGAPPTDTDDPNPVQFVTVRPDARFVIRLEGPDGPWVAWLADRLAEALDETGIGAKTRAGYGRLSGRGTQVYRPPREVSEDYVELIQLFKDVFRKGLDEQGRGVGGRFADAREAITTKLRSLDGEDLSKGLRVLGPKIRSHKKLKRDYLDWFEALETEVTGK